MVFLEKFETFFNLSKYALVFIGCIAEGPIVMVSSGFLLRLGQFELWPLYFSLMTGDFVADLGWYFVGRYGARKVINKYGHRFGLTPERIHHVEERFRKYQDKILVISKLTMGFGFAVVTLTVAGMLRVPFRRYAMLNLVGGFIWTAFLVLVGYFFGNVYAYLPSQFRFMFIILIIALVVYSLWALNRYFTKIQKI